MESQRQTQGISQDADFLKQYQPHPEAYDELIGQDGKPRAHWRELMALMQRLGEPEINRRFGLADRHMREAGVFYRIYGERGGTDRPWPLSHMPLILDEPEWNIISKGMIQRAE